MVVDQRERGESCEFLRGGFGFGYRSSSSSSSSSSSREDVQVKRRYGHNGTFCCPIEGSLSMEWMEMSGGTKEE